MALLTTWLSVLVSGCGVIGGIGDDERPLAAPFGEVEFHLDLPGSEQLTSVDLHLVCTNLDQHHVLDLTNGEVLAAFGGLEVGPCRVDVSSVSDQGRSCEGGEDFQILAGQTTDVTVTVLCQGQDETPSGGVRFDVDFDFFSCADDRIAGLEADPADLLLGDNTVITVSEDPDAVVGAPTVAFELRNDAEHTGEAVLSQAPPPCAGLDCIQVTCTGVGDTPEVDPMSGLPSGKVLLVATLEDDECFDTEVLSITCLRESVCGDLDVSGIEQCDDGNVDNGDGCNSECAFEYCGDGVLNQTPGIEECDGNDGLLNPSVQDCDPITCQIVPICGNGFTEGPEECDDDNLSNVDDCTNSCETAACGDGFVHSAVEECDDGNASSQDDCTNLCTIAECGDGFTHAGVEQCDDANASNTDACLVSCLSATCGDGFTHAGVEQCDDANASNTDACLVSCLSATCGDGFTHAGVEQCDDANASNTDACTNICHTAVCGDGFTYAGVEQCDDANASNTDACLNACLNASCGDGFVHTGTEQCDDANGSNTDACTNVCNSAVCGDGFTRSGVEQCDDGNASNTDACVNGCINAVCGDSYTRYSVEQCDDANAINTDGCINTCESALISDDFNRLDSSTIGGVWTEATAGSANALISSNKLRLDGDDGSNRPTVKTSFTSQSTGVLMWTFDMDFARTTEASYFQFMQLGTGMVDGNQTTGVAVDLSWGMYMASHNQFGYKNSGGSFVNALGGTTAFSGSHRIQVLVDVANKTYDIITDDVLRVAAAPFRNASVTSISEMRFFQHQMDTTAAGRTIDNVKLTKAVFSENFNRANSSTIGNGWSEYLASVNPGNAVIMTNRLQFNGANGITSPVVAHTLPVSHAGTMTWGFTMNFTRNGEANPYFQFMQLGDGVSDTDQVDGVVVDLSWGSYNSAHNQFGYKNSAGTFVNVMGGITGLTLTHYIVVVVNFATATYDIKVDGVVKASGVGFRDPTVSQITDVRFYEDQMDSTATGRTIDNVSVTLP